MRVSKLNRGTKTLIVDKDKPLMNLVVKALINKGVPAETVSTSKEAFKKVSEYHYDIIITELDLFEESGYSFIEKIREDDEDAIIMVFTSDTDVDKRVKALELGADYCIIKPFDFNVVLAYIKAAERRIYGGDYCPDVSYGYVSFKRNNVYIDGKKEDLTFAFRRLLRVLVLRKGKPISYVKLGMLALNNRRRISQKQTALNIFRLKNRLGKKFNKIIRLRYREGIQLRSKKIKKNLK